MSDNRTRVWFSLFVLAIFGLGLATGLFMGRRLGPTPRTVEPEMVRGPMGRGGPPPERLIERLDRVLRLTPDQRARVEEIFDARGAQLEVVQREVVARAQQEQRELQAEIRTVLTPQQQERFDRWLAEAPRGRGGRGRGGPPAR
ncbi:hypothetical protein BH23ACI1_BH23ACI1_02600 [soil metagenome]